MGIEPTISGLDLSFCVDSATRHNIHMYPDSPPKSSLTFSVRPRRSVGRVTLGLIRRPGPEVVGSIRTEVKRLFFYLVQFPTRADAQWVIHGLN